MSKSRKNRQKNRYYICCAIRDGGLIQIVTPFLFDRSVDFNSAKETCLWWLDKHFPKDDFDHIVEPGGDFDTRIIGWTLKLETSFSCEETKSEGIRRVDPITHFEGMCRK